ncbi:MAG: hypothetical protein GW858_13590 [Sphingomonadales bacterium]|nr:hypothetical protein [Sphingomonadales bacterium]NCQ22279.1 hypothetical protein [Sphingomonadales bacterium]NCT04704.1 hypothetical protein [Sphingomonadales bacterium]
MSVRFASANHPVRRLGWRAAGRGLIAPALARASNDNGRPARDHGAPVAAMDPVLAAALRHFAVHGLASAQAAVSAATEAGARGDAQGQDHWLAITQMFDRRLARRMTGTTAPA